ncbi:hypothetical protein DE146DRAFT_790989 [Phaeosphaeria sp. MPI-PUGE-AT-0046c]|nr:hypothetical protein DE146DRAFT_790989 [Phaeosphaeria sp. MPI-PUGE-AT-0046c]
MQNCYDNHKTCSQRNAGMNDTNRPGRLLDLTHLSHQNGGAIRLIETQPGISYQYACLSHRWDDLVKATKTTTDNVADNMKFMNTDLLPKKFTDAMHIAGSLGIQYLWIDSICTIQPRYEGDDTADLVKEMAKMGSIYQNSILTIGAISSDTSSGGCFMHTEWPDICMLLTPSCSPGTSTQTYFVGARILDGKGQCMSRDELLSRYPLIARGWVFQERILSTRFLNCNYGEFAFECLESALCECESNIAPHPARKSANAIRHINFTQQRRLLGSNAGVERGHALEYWKMIVHNYMELNLSVNSDVLPAMAGCAQALASSLELTYIAGLWEHSFDTDLLWHVRTDRRKRGPDDRKGEILRVKLDRPLDSTCPSWSWSSIKMPQPITHIERDKGAWEISDRMLESKIKVKHWVVKEEANPFGELDTKDPAYLEIEATLFPWYMRTICGRAKFDREGNTRFLTWDLHVKRHKNELFCTTDIEELDADNAAVEVFLDAHLRKEAMSEVQFHNCVSTKPPYCRLAQAYFLPVVHKESLQRALDAMLLLIRIPPVNGKSNCYKRVGLLKVMNEGADIKTWNDILLDRVQPIDERFWLF